MQGGILGGDYVRIGTVTSLVYALGAAAIWLVEPASRPDRRLADVPGVRTTVEVMGD